MKNLRVVKKDGENSFQEESKSNDHNVSREDFRHYSQATNRPSVLKGSILSPSSVSHEPPPSFLTQAPLGVSWKEASDITLKTETPVRYDQRKEFSHKPPLLPRTFEDEKKERLPSINQNKTIHPKKIQYFIKKSKKQDLHIDGFMRKLRYL